MCWVISLVLAFLTGWCFCWVWMRLKNQPVPAHPVLPLAAPLPELAAHLPPNQSFEALVEMFTHQNELVWGRLQTISIVQVPVVGAWAWGFIDPAKHHLYAFAVAILGWVLSCLTLLLIATDLRHRFHIRGRIQNIDQNFFAPESSSLCGWQILILVSCIFVLLDFALATAALAVSCGYWQLH